MRKYGEILFIGRCNLKCYYCLSKEMVRMRNSQDTQMDTPFELWENFEEFLSKCKSEEIDAIYLSSTITEPTLYFYLPRLISKLQNEGFKVGIRSNGITTRNLDQAVILCDEEISFSLQSLNSETYQKITGSTNMPNWEYLFTLLNNGAKKCRISIVVNRYNEKEIPDILSYLSKYKDAISYIQLRKVYKYNQEDEIDAQSYKNVTEWIQKDFKKTGNYFESEIYDYNGIQVSLWNDVFRKESIQSINYFTDGIISTNNLLIPAYEKGDVE